MLPTPVPPEVAAEPMAGGPFEPPGRFAAVEPLSDSLARALREAAELDDELDDPLFGVLKRLSAVESAVPPLAELPDEPDAELLFEADGAALLEVEEDADDEEELDDEEADEELLEELEEELLDPLKVGVLEMEVVVARDADGSVEFGAWRLPRSCGTMSAA